MGGALKNSSIGSKKEKPVVEKLVVEKPKLKGKIKATATIIKAD